MSKITIQVTRKERLHVNMGLSVPAGATHMDSAAVVVERMTTKVEMGLTKYSTETEWFVDYQFVNGIPVFNHGEGDRGCMKRSAKDDLLEAIEAAPLDDEAFLELQKTLASIRG